MREAEIRCIRRFFERICAELDVFDPHTLVDRYGLAVSTSYHYLSIARKLGIVEKIRHGLYRCRNSTDGATPTPVAKVDGDRLVLELRLGAVESLRYTIEAIERKLQILESSIKPVEVIEKRLELLEQRLYAIEQQLRVLTGYLDIDVEVSTRPSDEVFERKTLELLSARKLMYLDEILEELRLEDMAISLKHLVKLLRKLTEEGKIIEIAQRLFTLPELAGEITVDEIKQKYESLGLSRIPPPLTTTKTIYRAMKYNTEVIVLPNSR